MRRRLRLMDLYYVVELDHQTHVFPSLSEFPDQIRQWTRRRSVSIEAPQGLFEG